MKIIQIFILGFFISTTFLISSCEEKDKKTPVETLVGTTWIADFGEGAKNTYMFTSATEVTYIEDWIDVVAQSDTSEGTYTYNHPNITVSIGGDNISATVNGSIMTIGGFEYQRQ